MPTFVIHKLHETAKKTTIDESEVQVGRDPNGVKSKKYRMKNGDLVEVGSNHFRFVTK